MTPLLYAISMRAAKIAKTLIDKGADVHYADKVLSYHTLSMCTLPSLQYGFYSSRCGLLQDGKTPLIRTAEEGLVSVTLALIKKGARVDDKDKVCDFVWKVFWLCLCSLPRWQ